MRKISTSIVLQYLVLLIILLLSGWFFLKFNYLKQVQMLVLCLTGFVYIVWGIVHHYLEGDLHPKIIFEYLSTAVLGVIIIWFLLLRS